MPSRRMATGTAMSHGEMGRPETGGFGTGVTGGACAIGGAPGAQSAADTQRSRS